MLKHNFQLYLYPRQEKVVLRMFAERPSGFKGGLSAKNYIAISKASRATASRNLADLVQKKSFKKNGKTTSLSVLVRS